MQSVLKAFLDPTTSMGTARWVAIGMTAYDIARHHLNLTNGAVLLLLAGVDIAARWFNQGPRIGPTAAP
ncbi:MAG: hypothetical protein Q8K67_11310 [Geothrix sp.]|nr:hypothetical protein [Geothrix sp.]